MRKIAAAGSLAFAALALGGCQSLFGSPGARADASTVDLGDYFEARLAAGRAHLEAGRPAKAAIAFRQASYDPRYAGEAYNGMAIAFDRIGRTDLAEHYFTMAVKAAPGDPRFSRNLARFQGHADAMEMYAEVEGAPADELAVADFGQPDVRGPVTIGIDQVRGPVARIVTEEGDSEVRQTADREVRVVRTRETSETRPVRSAAARVTKAKSGQRQARATLERMRRSAQARRGYPIRIVLRDIDDASRAN